MVRVGGRLVALESVDPPGVERVMGASMSETIKDWVIPAERDLFVQLVRDVQPNDPTVPQESRGVQDSIYQLGQDIPLANRPATAAPSSTTPVPVSGATTTTASPTQDPTRPPQ
jgi:hypothetical protein